MCQCGPVTPVRGCRHSGPPAEAAGGGWAVKGETFSIVEMKLSSFRYPKKLRILESSLSRVFLEGLISPILIFVYEPRTEMILWRRDGAVPGIFM